MSGKLQVDCFQNVNSPSSTQSKDLPNFLPSAITKIQSTKSAENGLKFYRVVFSTLTLTCMVNFRISGNAPTMATTCIPDLSQSKAWIPAPILEHALPLMVMEYNQSRRLPGDFPNRERLALEPVCTVI